MLTAMNQHLNILQDLLFFSKEEYRTLLKQQPNSELKLELQHHSDCDMIDDA